jgi:hypothetical protein
MGMALEEWIGEVPIAAGESFIRVVGDGTGVIEERPQNGVLARDLSRELVMLVLESLESSVRLPGLSVGGKELGLTR